MADAEENMAMVGAATLAANAATASGLFSSSAIAGTLGAVTVGKAGVVIAALTGPVGWVIGGALLAGGVAMAANKKK